MRLHTDRQLFKDAINFASRPATDGGLGISPLFIEKDYWVSFKFYVRLFGLDFKDET